MAAKTEFQFRWLVELLDKLSLTNRGHPLSLDIARQHTLAWFKKHGDKIIRHGPSALAFLACVLPNRLPHRTYGLREKRLADIVANALRLPNPGRRRTKLESWTTGADFATLVEEVMHEAENPPARKQVTLEELDAALCELAANSGFLAPQMQRFRTNRPRYRILEPILRRLSSKEAKWLMRMLLKAYSSAAIPEQAVLRSFHFLLPDLLAIQNSFEAAINTLNHEDMQNIPHNPPMEDRDGFRQLAAKCMHPKLGVMIQRQPYDKGRSIKHCLNMAEGRTMSVERKYDGEYCQIHIDVLKPHDRRIQIFSKSGKDSTADRQGLHWAIKESLQLDDAQCKIKANCILEGELLVWSRLKEKIQPFHAIRKHVLHGGRNIGTAADSPRSKDDHLIIMYYDLLYLDNESFLNSPLRERRLCLEKVVNPMDGVGMIGTRNVVNFRLRDAQNILCTLFVRSIRETWEGLVLKGMQDPYFSWERRPRVIKLKRDYVTGLAQSVDLCIIGGFREQLVVDQLGVGDLSWTSFYLACFDNKDEVEEFQALPKFRVVDVLNTNCISKADIIHLNREGQYRRMDAAEASQCLDVSFERNGPRRSGQLFRKPFVVEVMGAGFEKPSDAAYFTLRFPRVRLHLDRTFVNTSSFDELQAMAKESFKPVRNSDTEDIVRRIQKANGKHAIVEEGWSQETCREAAASSAASTPVMPISRSNGLLIAHTTGSSSAQLGPISLSRPPPTIQTEGPIAPPGLNRRQPGSEVQSHHPEPTEARDQDRRSSEGRDLYMGSSLSSITHLPLNENPNPLNTRGNRRPLEQDPAGEIAQNPDSKRTKSQPCATVRCRVGASSLAMLNSTFLKKRFQCTVPNDSRWKEKGVQVLAHICRTPSPTAVASVSRILTSHWCTGTDNPVFGRQSGCKCSNCRLILIIVADESKLVDVARDLKETSAAVADIRKQALEKLSLNPRFGKLTHQGGENDQKLVVFLLKSARPAISEIEKEVKEISTAYGWYVTRLNKVFKDHFAGAIFFSFPKPFFSPAMAWSLFQGVKGAPDFAIQDADGAHDHLRRLVALGLPMQSKNLATHSVAALGSGSGVGPGPSHPGVEGTGSHFPAVTKASQLESQGSTQLEWKWSKVCKLMGSLGCDADQV
ncbi:uncharacterized protein A1O9_01644 [Exophiala aquamarina CBS 119918]|uniref:ATP-dependent DNA ligase family profile domain-containing protein n=1 Tax=Exophiala aquamarina CBS 119918 TaxID=1182545 RepID=A0A072PUY4_9EURO|nr:uncharacterized protein A1O9_01644 [Exophiala aquamarina CBS 119918]KEF63666.1 hypothetical protein A1O9_01644 [Exophiala aquamarina CBS 119918]